MRIITKLCGLCIIVTLFSGCHKGHDGDGPGPGPGLPDIPVPTLETVDAMFISSIERDVNGFGVKAFTVFNNNGNVRWKKMGRGYASDGYTTYAKGLIFSSEPDMNSSNFYAYDINTGAEVWSKTNSTEYFYYPIVRNDTLFCGTSIINASSGNVAAFNAKTGALYWRKPIGNPYWPLNMVLDGGNLFYLISTSSVDSKVVSFNINTQTVNWTSPSIGINFAAMFSNLVVSGSRVVVKSGTKLLTAFNRSIGTVAWTVPGIPFEQPLLYNNTVYGVCSRDVNYPCPDSLLGIYAFNESTGSLKWKWKKPVNFNGGTPYISGSTIFFSGIKADSVFVNETGFLGAFNLATGNQQWMTNTGLQYENISMFPVAVGNKVFVFKNSSGLPGSSARIVRYDFVTGQAKDSIILTGESFGKLFVVGGSDKVYTTR